MDLHRLGIFDVHQWFCLSRFVDWAQISIKVRLLH